MVLYKYIFLMLLLLAIDDSDITEANSTPVFFYIYQHINYMVR